MSNFIDRVKAQLYYSSLMQRYQAWKAQARGPTVFEMPGFRKAHYFSMLVASGIIAINFYSGILCTKTREETFKRNYALLEAKFGDEHKKAFGEDTQISKYGYPDMGNNLYADLLPYKDWFKLNNA